MSGDVLVVYFVLSGMILAALKNRAFDGGICSLLVLNCICVIEATSRQDVVYKLFKIVDDCW